MRYPCRESGTHAGDRETRGSGIVKHFFVSCAAELAESYAFDWRIALWLRDMMSWTERGASGVPPRPFGPSPTQTFRPFIFAEWSIYFAKRSVDFALAGRHDGLEGALLFGRALSPALSHALSLSRSFSLSRTGKHSTHREWVAPQNAHFFCQPLTLNPHPQAPIP